MNKPEVLAAFESAMGSCINKDPEFIFTCPDTDCPSRAKGHKKMSVNLDKGAYHCWVCEFSGSSLLHLAHYLGIKIDDLETEDLQNEIETELNEDSLDQINYKHIIKIPSNYIPIDQATAKTNNLVQAIKYLYKRGIGNFDITKYRIHYNTEDYDILIPSYDEDGDVNMYFSRSIFDKTKYMPPFPKKQVVANELFVDWSDEIVLVEGFFDAFTAGDNSVPLLGSYIKSDYLIFQRILHHKPKCVILALDRDAFKKKTLRIASLLFKHGIKVKIVRFPDDRDINDIGREKFNVLRHGADIYHDLYEMEYELNQL